MTIMTVPTSPTYTEEDHATWAALYARQWARMPNYACQLFLDSMPRLGLDPQRLPDPAIISERLHDLTGWSLGDAQNEYLGQREWFEHIAERRFPVTNYIRRPNELLFTPLPDLFHEYFGHLALFTDQRFADTAYAFGPLFLSANERQQLEIARLWWFTLEFGIVRERGELRAVGAGLLSSIAELDKAFHPDTRRLPFDMRSVVAMPSATHTMHEVFFVLDDVEQIGEIISEYARIEGLPQPF